MPRRASNAAISCSTTFREAPADLVDSLDGYLGGREASPLGWSPQGQLLIATRFGDVDQLHLVEKPEGARRQIGFLHEPVTDAAFSPDPGRAAYFYLKDSGGSGAVQLYYQRLGQPGAKLLTDGKSRNGAPVWSNSGREIAFFTNARDGASYDIDIVDPESDTLPHLAMAGDDAAAWYPLDWSPDDRKLLVLKYVSAGEAYLYVVDLATGQKREVDPAPGRVGIGGARFSRDGQGVYLISDRDGEFRRLRYVGFFNSEKSVLSDHIPWDVEELAISRDGRHLAFVSNENGASKLNLLDLRAHQDRAVPALPAPGLIDHLSFDSDGKQLAFGYTSANAPRDAYVLDLAANRLLPWTRSEPGAVDAAGFVTPRLAQFPTFDRVDGRPRQIPVYVYEPAVRGAASRAAHASWRTRGAVPAGIRPLDPVRGERIGICRRGAEHPRLVGLRQELPGAGRRRAARRRRQGCGGAHRLGGFAGLRWMRSTWWSPGPPTAATLRWPR